MAPIFYTFALENLLTVAEKNPIMWRGGAFRQLWNGISNDLIALEPGAQVDVQVAMESEIGWRVIVDGKHWGMLYRNQVFAPVRLGDTFVGFVRRVTEGGRIDVAIQKQGYDEVKDAAERLLALVKEHHGLLLLGDKSAPEEIARLTSMSKKVFKRAMGSLMKRGDVQVGDTETKLLRSEN